MAWWRSVLYKGLLYFVRLLAQKQLVITYDNINVLLLHEPKAINRDVKTEL